jgi:hypothetical protein
MYLTGVARLDDGDLDAVLERAQLLEGLEALQGGGWHPGELQQAPAPIDVQPHVFPGLEHGVPVAPIRNRRAREIEGSPGAIDHHLAHVWVEIVGRVIDAPPERGQVDRRIGEGREGLLDHRGLDERFVPLNVDHEVAIEPACHFGDAIGPAHVRRVRHARMPAKGLHRVANAIVVGGDDDRADGAALGHAPVDVLDERATAEVGERLAREPGRRVARRDDCQNAFGRGRARGPLG